MCCDVGGTSTDVSLVVEGRPFVENTFELEHDMIINALSTEISSVGAGGGSIVSISPSGDVLVGPASAGAEPGPACYGWGGELPTVTDAALLMGILDPDGFASGEVHLDSDRAWKAFEALESPLSVEQRIAFAYRIAVNNIAEEVTNIAIRHGVDPRDFSLLAYGAAGPMLLPAALELLHVKQVVIPPHPGNFSALGLLSTDQVYSDSRSNYVVLSPDVAPQIAALYEEMEAGLRERVGDVDGVSVRRSFDGRLLRPELGDAVHRRPGRPHHRRDHRGDGRGVQRGVRQALRQHLPDPGAGRDLPRRARRRGRQGRVRRRRGRRRGAAADPDRRAAPLRRRAAAGGRVHPLGAADRRCRVAVPRSSARALSTTFVCPGQVATVGPFGELVIRREQEEN